MVAKIIIVFVLVGLFVAGYFLFFQEGATGPQILEQDKFVQAYVELASLAERMPIGTPEYDREKRRVLETMGVTPEQVEKALATYNDHPEMWQPVWERIQKELEKREQDLEPASATTPADTN
ncbi:MAG: hypothetical protein Kow0074_08800 [Candidatus Zixiibacteriota bacterium]